MEQSNFLERRMKYQALYLLMFGLPGLAFAAEPVRQCYPTLTLPELLTPDAFARLDSAIDQALAEPRQALGDAAPDPGSIEYDSWLIRQQ